MLLKLNNGIIINTNRIIKVIPIVASNNSDFKLIYHMPRMEQITERFNNDKALLKRQKEITRKH